MVSAENSECSIENSRSTVKVDKSGLILPLSIRAISFKSNNKLLAISSEVSIFLICSRSCFDTLELKLTAEENKRAADNGCNKSWLQARKYWLFFKCACSAFNCALAKSWFAFSSSTFACSSSFVRVNARLSRSVFSSFRYFSARRYSVISEKIITKPPPGIGLPSMLIILPFESFRSDLCLLPARIYCKRFCTCDSMSCT